MANVGRRMFFDELSKLLRKTVTVIAKGKTFVGNLQGFDPETLNLCLTHVIDEKGKVTPQVFLNGQNIDQIIVTETPYDLRGLADRLEKVFPRMVRLYDDIGVIVVMDRVRVNADGILEGTGPVAERVQRVYEEYTRDAQKA